MRILLTLMCFVVLSCAGKKIDQSRQFEERHERQEGHGMNFERGRAEALKYQRQLYDLSKIGISFSAPDSLPYYFRLGGFEYFGSGNVDFQKELSGGSEEKTEQILRDTIVLRDTISRIEYVYLTDDLEVKTEPVRKSPFWWIVLAFGLGLITPRLVRLAVMILKPI